MSIEFQTTFGQLIAKRSRDFSAEDFFALDLHDFIPCLLSVGRRWDNAFANLLKDGFVSNFFYVIDINQ